MLRLLVSAALPARIYLKGGAKKTAGRATGSSRLKAEGRGDQVKGDTKMAGAKIKDAFRK